MTWPRSKLRGVFWLSSESNKNGGRSLPTGRRDGNTIDLLSDKITSRENEPPRARRPGRPNGPCLQRLVRWRGKDRVLDGNRRSGARGFLPEAQPLGQLRLRCGGNRRRAGLEI